MSTVSRFLFVVPPLAGHVNPTLAVGRELGARGHEVAWAGPEEVVAELMPADATLLRVPLAPGVRDHIAARADDLRGAAALKHLVGEFLVPLATCMVPGVEAAVERFRPDVLVVDQQALAGVAVALARGLPWATAATTSALLADPMELIPRVKEWADGLQRDVLRSAGVDPQVAATVDLRFSPELVVVFSTPAFVGGNGYPDHYAFVGPALAGRPDATPFPWDWLGGGGPHVLVSLGTLNWHNGGRFFAAAASALGGMDARGIIVAPPELVPDAPPNVLVRPRVPQLALLPHLDAVVCHGGHNTVCEALAHGLPLVVAPIRDDQPAIAAQVEAARAGVRVRFRRAGPDDLRAAMEAALGDRALRDGAGRIRQSFAAAGGPPQAAARLERLVPAVSRR
jgi:MGT family glycosyltransferase